MFTCELCEYYSEGDCFIGRNADLVNDGIGCPRFDCKIHCNDNCLDCSGTVSVNATLFGKID